MARTHREQTLAEHLYLVTMYADELAHRILTEHYDDSKRLCLLSWTLEHDTPEILTGDIPTPAKRKLQAGYDSGHDPLELLEMSIASDSYKKAKKNIRNTELVYITKLGDLIDSIVFISIEGVTEHSVVIEKRLHEMFHSTISIGKEFYPQYNWDASIAVLDDILNGEDGQLEFEAKF
jgi:5'-deoxynucleotidase